MAPRRPYGIRRTFARRMRRLPSELVRMVRAFAFRPRQRATANMARLRRVAYLSRRGPGAAIPRHMRGR